MKDIVLNDWEQKIDPSKIKEKKDYNLQEIYKQAHSELSLQQSKRDQIITIYLALCSFLLPFALGEEMIPMTIKGLIFIVVGLVGVLFSYITIRYRDYKEAYWLCCQTITVLLGIKTEELDKVTVQRAFAHCLYKKGKGYLRDDGDNKHFCRLKYVKKNIFSSETIHFVIIALMCSFISALGVSLILTRLDLLISIIVGVIIFAHLIYLFFDTCIKIYLPLERLAVDGDELRRDDAFNSVFKKAWFLHFYYDLK